MTPATSLRLKKKHAKHILDSELTTRLVKETFQKLPEVALVPGFISTDKNSGEVTNFGTWRFRLYRFCHSCGTECG